MKKIYLLIISMILMIGLTGCDLFNIGGTTTTEAVETTTVDFENYLEINTIEDLQAVEMNKSYILNADLDLTGIEWEPIGTYLNPYLGNFDGNDYTVSNLSLTIDHIHNGLFGYVTGNITNLNLESVSIDYEANFITYVGGLAGYSNGEIDNCTVNGMIDVSNDESSIYAGMLLGFTQGKLYQDTTVEDFAPNVITNNIVSGSINAVSMEIGYIGGMIGKTYNSTVGMNNSFVDLTVDVAENNVFIGGVIGHNYGGILHDFSDIVDEINIYIYENVTRNTITVNNDSGSFSVGGFVGYNSKGYQTDNYVESTIILQGEATEGKLIKVGGYFGENWNSPAENIFIRSDFTNSLTGESVIVNSGALGGGLYGDESVTDVYVFTPSDFQAEESTQSVDLSTVEAPDFFEDTFDWNSDFLTELG